MSAAAYTKRDPQSAATVLMVRPAHFGFNRETAASNAFQHAPVGGAFDARHDAVLAEFDAVASALESAGVEVLVVADSDLPHKPDAIFPNNWVSFHRDGGMVLYPMMAPNRRAERRVELLDHVLREGAFVTTRTLDLSHHEHAGKYLEGTGSMVLDRRHRLAYACLSPRTHVDVLNEFARHCGYELLTFEASDASQRPIYHTNVLMAIGTAFAVLCGESIDDPSRRRVLEAKLDATGHALVDITRPQMLAFAGNVLEMDTSAGHLLVLSTTALHSLDAAQRRRLESFATLLPVSIPTIERCGGGGVRCMLAEVHLPKLRPGMS